MSSTIGSATSADSNSLIRSLLDQSENTRSLVTSNGGLTKPTQSQPPPTQVPQIGVPPEQAPSSAPVASEGAATASWNDSLSSSLVSRSRMLSGTAQGIRTGSNFQIQDPTTAADHTSQAAGYIQNQARVSLLAQANATPEIALRLLD